MGKTIIQQARGHGSLTYRVRRRGYRFEIKYPNVEGKGIVLALVDSAGHTAPLARIKINDKEFYNLACEKLVEGQEINIGKAEKEGDIAMLKNLPIGARIFNIEVSPGDGGKFVRVAGCSAMITKKENNVGVMLPSGKEVELNEKCRATLGVISGAGRKEKPFMTAGRKFYLMKSRNKLWPRTSAVKMNVIDHPFGCGRGKNISHGRKGKIAKRNAPAGARVGLIRPRRTGRKKR